MDLNLSGIAPKDRARVKNEVGEFIIEEILLRVADGKSPLKGTPRWSKLSSKYAKDEKGGNTTPNLELDGDLLDALEFKRGKGNKIEIGIFDKDETGKADGHNNHTGKSKLPKRRFIPDDTEQFYKKITDGVKEIISENKAKPVKPKITDRVSTEDESSINLSDILSDATLTRLFGEYFDES